jgi:hypothetical protein
VPLIVDVWPQRVTNVCAWVSDHVPEALDEPESHPGLPVGVCEDLALATWLNGRQPARNPGYLSYGPEGPLVGSFFGGVHRPMCEVRARTRMR